VSRSVATSRAAALRCLEPNAVCPSCGALGLEVFFEHLRAPVHSCRLLPSRRQALDFPCGTIRLGFCSSCGFITNVAYDAAQQDYSVSYEETQGFSGRFQVFAEELAKRWIADYDLREKDIVEIGCGKGGFLLLLCELGRNRGIGIDPSVVDERITGAAANRVTFYKELYAPRHAAIPADAVVCRHTLEHIHPVESFVALVGDAVAHREGAVALFELPDVVRVLREGAFWDIYYEHCSYFSPGSLARAFRRNRFDVLDLELDYDDQYILLEARAGEGQHPAVDLEEPVASLTADVETFRERFTTTAERWCGFLSAARDDGKLVVLWGAGSKAVAFLTTLMVGSEVGCAVDVNPYKQGKYLAGTGHEVVGPEALVDLRPDVVIAMNPIYLSEIRATLDGLGLTCELLAV
jgi:SAM-dependent methyltransferase